MGKKVDGVRGHRLACRKVQRRAAYDFHVGVGVKQNIVARRRRLFVKTTAGCRGGAACMKAGTGVMPATGLEAATASARR